MEALGAAEAEAAISGEAASVEGATYSALAEVRLSAEVLAARISGLQHKLSSHDAEVLAAVSELEAAREEFTKSCLQEFRRQLLRAAGDFVAVLKQGAALADALGADYISGAIRGITVQDPTAPGERLVSLDATEFQERTFIPVPVWKGDTAAEAVFAEYSEIGTVARDLKACQ
jgi:hypothetical protein